jgi:hypothetical protein
MDDELPEPSEDDNTDCHLQQIGMGTLICRAAKQTGDKTTNEVSPKICFTCPAGRIYREVGCEAVLPKVRFYPYMGGSSVRLDSLFCRIRKRETTIDYCRTCSLANAETTRDIIQSTRGLFIAQNFHSAYKDLEKARLGIRDGDFDGAITSSISFLESVLRECHLRLNKSLPGDKTITGFWKSSRTILKLDEIAGAESTAAVMNSLHGLIANLGSLRNRLSDAHGRDSQSPTASALIAELTVNTAATLATTAIRRFNQIAGDSQ